MTFKRFTKLLLVLSDCMGKANQLSFGHDDNAYDQLVKAGGIVRRHYYSPTETIAAVELVIEGVELHAQRTVAPSQEELEQEAAALAAKRAHQEQAIQKIDIRLAELKP
jgi:hypothetical protein